MYGLQRNPELRNVLACEEGSKVPLARAGGLKLGDPGVPQSLPSAYCLTLVSLVPMRGTLANDTVLLL